MRFDIEGAKRESDVLEGAVADFRKACSEAKAKLVEGSPLSAGKALWGMDGDLAGMRRILKEVPVGHVFIAVERYDLEREVATLTGPASDARIGGQGATLRRALGELKGLDGLVVRVRAAASFAGVPFACVQEPEWVRKATAIVEDTVGSTMAKAREGTGAPEAKEAPSPQKPADAERVVGSDTRAAAEMEREVAGVTPSGKAPDPKPRSKIFGFARN